MALLGGAENVSWLRENSRGFPGTNAAISLAQAASAGRRSLLLVRVDTDTRSGKAVNAKPSRVGELPGCLGSTSDPVTDDFSVESTFNGLSFTGLGDCRVLKADGPGRGIASWRRTLHRTGLPAPYTGGLPVSNTLARQAPNGPQTQPPGHTQSSIATVRPWRVPWKAARG